MTRLLGASRPLHVLLTSDVVGGVWDFCMVLANELASAGHHATVLALGDPSPLQLREATAVGADLLSKRLKLEWMQESAADVRASLDWAARVIQKLRPDVVHANQYALGCVVAQVPVVVTAHSDVLSWLKWVRNAGEDGPMPLEWADYAALVRRGLRAADQVTAVSRFLAAEVRGSYGLERLPRVIYNGWPLVGLPPPVVGHPRSTMLAGRAWDCAKDIQLAATAAQGWSPGRVVLAGERRHPESGAEAEIGPPVELIGRVPRPELERMLRQTRVYLSPARYDPFGLLPLQAALAGCPLLLSDIPSYRELWDGAALFFRRADADDLRRKWDQLLHDDQLATDLAGRAWHRATTRFSARRMADEYLDLYASLLAQPNRVEHLGRAYA